MDGMHFCVTQVSSNITFNKYQIFWTRMEIIPALKLCLGVQDTVVATADAFFSVLNYSKSFKLIVFHHSKTYSYLETFLMCIREENDISSCQA